LGKCGYLEIIYSLLGEEGRKREGEERRVEEREMENILVVYEFAEKLQCSAKLLSIVAPHHFAELLVELAGEFFCGLAQQTNQKTCLLSYCKCS
jgi:hypothetical protein